MNQQAVNRARPIKNFYDCPSSEAYSSLTLSAAPWAGLICTGRRAPSFFIFRFSLFIFHLIARLTGQTFLTSGLGDARPLPGVILSNHFYIHIIKFHSEVHLSL
jgi:hypothetical protein